MKIFVHHSIFSEITRVKTIKSNMTNEIEKEELYKKYKEEMKAKENEAEEQTKQQLLEEFAKRFEAERKLDLEKVKQVSEGKLEKLAKDSIAKMKEFQHKVQRKQDDMIDFCQELKTDYNELKLDHASIIKQMEELGKKPVNGDWIRGKMIIILSYIFSRSSCAALSR